MCGIVGYVGKRNACDILVNGLRRLEYRGYDSAGVALQTGGRLTVVKQTGKIASLRRFKDDVKEVLTGYECGIGVENFNDLKIGDNLEAFVMLEVEATLE